MQLEILPAIPAASANATDGAASLLFIHGA